MTTEHEEEREISLAEYAELVNGKIAGIDLVIRIMILSTYDKDGMQALLKNLKVARTGIDDEVERGAFYSNWMPIGSSKVVDGIIAFLTKELEESDERQS